MPGSFPSVAAGPSGSISPRAVPIEGLSTRFEVDQTLPTTSVQIRLADGTRYGALGCVGIKNANSVL